MVTQVLVKWNSLTISSNPNRRKASFSPQTNRQCLKLTTGQPKSIDQPHKENITPRNQLVMFYLLRRTSRSPQASNGFKSHEIRFLSWGKQIQKLSDDPLRVLDHPINMQRQQIEWEVSCHSLWDMAHMSARVGDIFQHQILSSTHPLLISLSLTHTLSRRKNKGRK